KDRRDRAALGLVDVPDPHALADEGRVPADPGVFEGACTARFGAGGGGEREQGEDREQRQRTGDSHYAHLPTRDLLPALLLATAALLAIAPGAGAARPPKIADATVKQKGQDLVLSVRTAKPVALGALEPRPDVRRAGTAYLCFGFA